MENRKHQLVAILNWLLPSSLGFIIYSLICGTTLVVSNAGLFRELFILPDNFNFKNAVFNSINNLTQQFVGDDVARSAVVAIFWAMVGLFVYMVIWVLINYSDELGNDLAVTSYIHPPGVDTKTPLRHFITRIVFQLFAVIVLVFYLNLFLSVLIPRLGVYFQTSTQTWPSRNSLLNGLIGLVGEFMVLHVLIVLTRLLTLRKRIFG